MVLLRKRERRKVKWEVIHGDCREVLPGIGSVDAIVTDPPYGIDFAAAPTMYRRAAGHKPEAWDGATPEIGFVLTKAKLVAVWGGHYFGLPKSRGWLCWYKPDAPPSMGHFDLCWTNGDRPSRLIRHSIRATNAERCGHATQKPARVMRWTLETIGVEYGMTVLDPFCGSGSTGVACAQLGINFIGIEIDAGYCEIARRRIAEAANHLFADSAS